MKKSKFFRLNLRDVFRGLILSVASTLFTALKLAFDAHGLNLTITDVKIIVASCLSSFCGYLAVNLFTNSLGKLFKRESNDTNTN